MSRLFIGIAGTLFLAWTALVACNALENGNRIQSGPQNQSLLYQTYDPEPVIRTFRYEHESYGAAGGGEGHQLIKSIEQGRTFIRRFTMQAIQESALMHALLEDITLRLKAPGITVTDFRSEPDGGFTYTYVIENGRGSISVEGLTHQMTKRRYPVSSSLDDVEVKIAITELWTRPARDTQWWMAAVD